jgi:hypothetical protein
MAVNNRDDDEAIDEFHLDAIADADPYPYWYDDADEPDSNPTLVAPRRATCASSAAATPGCGRRSSPRNATRRATSS